MKVEGGRPGIALRDSVRAAGGGEIVGGEAGAAGLKGGLLPAPAAGAAVAALQAGEVLAPGQRLWSPSGQHSLVLQGDGNLVVYSQGRALWSAGTQGTGADRLGLQGDGNLVLRASDGQAVWSTGTAGTDAQRLIMQDDGNLVLYGGGAARWNSGSYCDRITVGQVLHPGHRLTARNRSIRLILQGDGNLVLYSGSTARWHTQTVGSGADRLILQGDGNLVLYSGSTARWHTQTSNGGSGGQVDAALAAYPHKNAAPYHGNYEWGNPPMSAWGYYKRNCTDYVAWWLAAHGVSSAAYRSNGNGGAWGSAAAKPNVSAVATPRAGDIAVFAGTSSNPWGHLALVTAVSGSQVSLAEYNVPGGSGNPNTRAVPSGSVSTFLRFAEAQL